MHTDITLQLHDPRWKSLLRPYCKTVREVCNAALAATTLSKPDCRWGIAVVLADDAFIHNLNRDYRGKNAPTNVLSFPSENLTESGIRRIAKGQDEHPLGDIVLALETIEREAREQGKTFRHHAMHLLAHGTLHLLGHDHMNDEDAAAMERREIKILKTLGVTNPYL
jgi:probable rRNA maturation factor